MKANMQTMDTPKAPNLAARSQKTSRASTTCSTARTEVLGGSRLQVVEHVVAEAVRARAKRLDREVLQRQLHSEVRVMPNCEKKAENEHEKSN